MIQIKSVIITEQQKNRILETEENHFMDFKSIDISPAKLTRHIAAFANADGGELFVGVDEDKLSAEHSWRGFSNQEAANAHLEVFERLFPLGQDFTYSFLTCPKQTGYLLHIEIHKTTDIKYSSDGKIYLRRGAQSLLQDASEEIERLKLNKGLTSFEIQTVDADVLSITNSTTIIEFLLDVISMAEPEAWLKKQQLIKGGKPTVAGILLFSEEPQAILPKRCSIKIYRYLTKNIAGSRETLAFDPITIEGCLYQQIKDAVSKTIEIIEGLTILGPLGFEKAKYPRETLHEIITNAVIHRDYSIADDIHIRIFENRIEVESPGRLPAHITVTNILSERFARNGAIVRIINKFPDPPNKDVGEGLNTAFEAMRKLRLKDPLIEQKENAVIVLIRHEPFASPEELVMEYLSKNPQINNSKGREISFISSENVMKRVFERLIDQDLIERIPGLKGKAIAYRKKEMS